MTSAQEYEPSPTEWVRKQVEQIVASGTTEGVHIMGRPVVLMTMRGARSGKLRKVPVMRVEHDGVYAVVASRGGAPTHPAWYFNLKSSERIEMQDGRDQRAYSVRELDGAERDQWWERAVAAYPPYADYQAKTQRRIPVLLLEPTQD
jgi:deazaflavin-dependent oxidoreductase (nitroreductase family)